MPSATFPRLDKTKMTVISVQPPQLPGGLMQRTQSGVINTRNTTARGWTWTESYGLIKSRDSEVQRFLAWVKWATNRMKVFTVKHPNKPGSGTDPNGTGSSGVTVNGGSQSGSSINTTGWPAGTSDVVMAGDWISIDGVDWVLEVTDSADSDGSGNATININPPIFAGSEPAGGASVTTTDVTVDAVITDSNIPETENAFYYGGLSLTFTEVPNS